jgi:hypothetical protein
MALPITLALTGVNLEVPLHIKLQWAPLNGIILGPTQTDPMNRMIPLTDMHFSINSKQAMEIFKK